MAQQKKTPATKPADISLVPRTQMVEEEINYDIHV